MTTYVLANVYMEADNLPRMWESVKTHIPGEVILVAVDGRYIDYDAPDDLSTDGTREYARANGHLIDFIGYECDKRTVGLRYIDTLAHPGDWVLSMDADEELTSFLSWPSRVGLFNFIRASRPEIEYGRCRLFLWEPGLEYRHRHYDLYDSTGALVASLEDAPVYELSGEGIHHNNSHSAERVETKRAYYRLLREREGHPSEVMV